MDSYKRAKESIVSLLGDTDYKVISLIGKWGTGKTHLWKSVSADCAVAVLRPIYVSAFGTKSAAELKLRILQNAYLQDSRATQKVLSTLGGLAAGWFRKATGADVESAAIAWLPKLVENRLIAVDDVERKHRSFEIDELLGFLDEYSETYRARFVVLMNSDHLSEGDSELLKRLHEKVIDAEVVLSPTSSEAISLLHLKTGQPHIAHSIAAMQALGLNNIRVIRRVLKSIEQVEKSADIQGVPTDRWVPATVLLTASHFRADEKLPPFDYVKRYNTYSPVVREQAPADPRHADWNATLEKLGFVMADAFDVILQEFLESGFLDRERLKQVFDKHRVEAHSAATGAKAHQILRALWWEPQLELDTLSASARELLPVVDRMSPNDVTDMAAALSEFGSAELADEFIDQWVATAERRSEYQQVEEGAFEDTFRPLNVKVHAKLREIRDRQHPPLKLSEVVPRIRERSGWGDRERIAMRSSTVDEYVEVLSSLSGTELRQFLVEHLGWVRHGASDAAFEHGVNNFVEACRRIRAQRPGTRLSKLIEDSFRSNGVIDRLVEGPNADHTTHS